MAALEVNVCKVEKTGTVEGYVCIPGLARTKVVSKKDGLTTEFANKSALSAAARSVAKSLGYETATLTEITLQEVPAKKAAKTSAPKKVMPKGDV